MLKRKEKDGSKKSGVAQLTHRAAIREKADGLKISFNE